MEILGIPIGDQDFCSFFTSKQHCKAKVLLSQLEEVGIVDPPQVALILLHLLQTGTSGKGDSINTYN